MYLNDMLKVHSMYKFYINEAMSLQFIMSTIHIKKMPNINQYYRMSVNIKRHLLV